MRFLVDNNLSPKVAASLIAAGHEATHVRDLGMHTSPDDEILALAKAEGRVLISADTDFGTLLAASGENAPSVLLVRRISGRRADVMTAIILANLEAIAADLDKGAMVVFGEESLRIRLLPIVPR